jgi:hypothetical protein
LTLWSTQELKSPIHLGEFCSLTWKNPDVGRNRVVPIESLSQCPLVNFLMTGQYGFLGKWQDKHHLTSMETILSSNRTHIKQFWTRKLPFPTSKSRFPTSK